MKKYTKSFTGVNFSTGNKKLKPNNDTKFLIWSLPAVTTCPFRTPNCERLCYARKAERIYPQVLPARTENYMDSLKDSFIWDTINTIRYFQKRWNKAKRMIVRIHESGDFYSAEYMRKWYEIAWYFNHNKDDNKPTVQFTAYTKSIDFIDTLHKEGDILENVMTIRASLWDDTPIHQQRKIKDMGLPIYTAFNKGDIPKEYHHCRCTDCATCLKCYNTKTKLIACEIH